ncbi:DoxX family protein [Streptomyces sp. 142MFCol3.1]|uniref:DoxX family protein n=1 Tax=Streptomyces sp. 142MFCol3.1 TaxID=1172179 RepID=UPI00041EE19E|nr:DoxX family protein [Streptomyces sp. 142MFCol3.1]
MFLATSIVSILLAAVLAASASGKLRHDPKQMETMRKVGFPASKLWLLAAAEFAGAAGLAVGLFWWPLGAAAAIGVIGYFMGAVASHVRVRDFKVAPAAILLAVAAGALTLRLLSA